MEEKRKGKGNPYLIPGSIVLASLMFSSAWLINGGKIDLFNRSGKTVAQTQGPDHAQGSAFDNKELFPEGGITLPVTWGDLGWKLASVGVIDLEKFETLYQSRGGLTEEQKNILTGKDNGQIVMNENNANFLLNMLWALGLANKSPILEKGQMMNPAYGGAGSFASTGGWTLAEGDAMDHYSKHKMFPMTPEQHALAEKVAQGIFRPCCGNGTHFPDCNHGMAMLGLIQLMASQGVSEEDMYKVALQVNSYWFPDQYATIAAYMKSQGTDWKDVSPKEMLSANYSSAGGFRNIMAKVSNPQQSSGGGGCGV